MATEQVQKSQGASSPATDHFSTFSPSYSFSLVTDLSVKGDSYLRESSSDLSRSLGTTPSSGTTPEEKNEGEKVMREQAKKLTRIKTDNLGQGGKPIGVDLDKSSSDAKSPQPLTFYLPLTPTIADEKDTEYLEGKANLEMLLGQLKDQTTRLSKEDRELAENALGELQENKSQNQGLFSDPAKCATLLKNAIATAYAKIKKSKHYATFSYNMIDVEDWLLTLFRVSGVVHDLHHDNHPTFLDFLDSEPGLGHVFAVTFGLGSLAFGADAHRKREIEKFNANAANIFLVLQKLFKEHLTKEQNLAVGEAINKQKIEDWKGKINEELIRILDEDEALKKKYSVIQLTYILLPDKTIQWALRFAPHLLEDGASPESKPSLWNRFGNFVTNAADTSYTFIAVTSLWFWVFWFNAALILGGFISLSAPFAFIGVIFIYPMCFGLSYLSRKSFNYTSLYLRTKVEENEFLAFDQLFFRNIASIIAEIFPSTKSFLEQNKTFTNVVNSLGYFFKAPFHALAFPSIFLSALFTLQERAIENNAWYRYPLYPVVTFIALPFVAVYFIFYAIKWGIIDRFLENIPDTQNKPTFQEWLDGLDEKIKNLSTGKKALFYGTLILPIFLFIFKAIWHLVNLPTVTAASLFHEMFPRLQKYMGFDKRQVMSRNASNLFSPSPHSPSSQKSVQDFQEANKYVSPAALASGLDPIEFHKIKNRNKQLNIDGISIFRRLIFWEKRRHKEAIKAQWADKERDKLVGMRVPVPTDLGVLPLPDPATLETSDAKVSEQFQNSQASKDNPLHQYEFNQLGKKHYSVSKAKLIFRTMIEMILSWYSVHATLIFLGWYITDLTLAAFAIEIATVSFGTFGFLTLSFPAIVGFFFLVAAVIHALYVGHKKYYEIRDQYADIEKLKEKLEVKIETIQSKEMLDIKLQKIGNTIIAKSLDLKEQLRFVYEGMFEKDEYKGQEKYRYISDRPVVGIYYSIDKQQTVSIFVPIEIQGQTKYTRYIYPLTYFDLARHIQIGKDVFTISKVKKADEDVKSKEAQEYDLNIEKNVCFKAKANELAQLESDIKFYLDEIKKYTDRLVKQGLMTEAQASEYQLKRSYGHSLIEGSEFFTTDVRDEEKPFFKDSKHKWRSGLVQTLFIFVGMFLLPGFLVVAPLGFWGFMGIFLGYVSMSVGFLAWLNYKKDPDYQEYKKSFLWSVTGSMAIQSGILIVRLFFRSPDTAIWVGAELFGGAALGITAPWVLTTLFVVVGLMWMVLKMYKLSQNEAAGNFMSFVKNSAERSYTLGQEIHLLKSDCELLRTRRQYLAEICEGLSSADASKKGSYGQIQVRASGAPKLWQAFCSDPSKNFPDVSFTKIKDSYRYLLDQSTNLKAEDPKDIYVAAAEVSSSPVVIYFPLPDNTFGCVSYGNHHFDERREIQFGEKVYFFEKHNGKLFVADTAGKLEQAIAGSQPETLTEKLQAPPLTAGFNFTQTSGDKDGEKSTLKTPTSFKLESEPLALIGT